MLWKKLAMRATRLGRAAALLLLLLAPPAASQPRSCVEGGRNANAPTTPRFATDGSTVLVLRVGLGEGALNVGFATALELVEVNVATKAPVTTVPLPTEGIFGSNLPCTLSTGLFASATWDWKADQGFGAAFCNNKNESWGKLPPALGGPACDSQGTSPASAHYNASWNLDNSTVKGHGDGAYPMWLFDREGLPQLSYDGRFVSLPCYASFASTPLKLGAWFDSPTPPPAGEDDSTSYDDKTIALVDATGAVDTITHLSGNEFFYGPLIPTEPQYLTSAVTTGEYALVGVLNPKPFFYVGGAADNGEGVMYINDDSLIPSKAFNRITNTPGYFSFGTLGLYSVDPPSASTTGAPPLLFVSAPSMRNAGQEGAQHEALRGLSVAHVTSSGNITLPFDEPISFQQLPGFEDYVGHPFGFVFESPDSVWLADAGPGAPGGPTTCSMLGPGAPCPPAPPADWTSSTTPPGLWDKYSCTLQNWVTLDTLLGGPWRYVVSVLVSSDAPCYSLAGRTEGSTFALYTTTAAGGTAAAPVASTLFRIDATTKAVTPILTSTQNTVWRGVTFPPRQRGNYTCPAGSWGLSCDLACAYNCCAPCRASCPDGATLIEACSFDSDNLCVFLSQSSTPTPTSAATGTPTSTTTGTGSATGTGTPSGTPTPTGSRSGTPSHTPSGTPSPSHSPRGTQRDAPPPAASGDGGVGAGVGIGMGVTLAVVGALGAGVVWAGLVRVSFGAARGYGLLGAPAVPVVAGGAQSLASSPSGAADAVRRLGALGGTRTSYGSA